jgi:hypothetical protein
MDVDAKVPAKDRDLNPGDVGREQFPDEFYCSVKMFVCLFDGVSRHFQQYFSYIMAVSVIGGGNRRTRRTRRKPPTCCKSLTNFIT